MARLFDGTNDSLQATPDLSGFNILTVSFYLYWDAFVDNDDLAMEYTADASATEGGWYIDPNHSTDSKIEIFMRSGSAANITRASFTRPSAAAWHHYVVGLDRSVNPDTIAFWIDGVSQTVSYTSQNNGTTNFPSSTLNFMARNNAALFGAGRMAEVAIWGGAVLTTGEAKALSNGVSPLAVRPDALFAYWPLMGRVSPEQELINKEEATVNGAVQTDHPRVFYPTRSHLSVGAHHVVQPAFAPSWAHSWVNPAGVAHPRDISDRQHTTFAIPPFDLLGAGTELPWLGQSRTPSVKAPDWPFHHLTKTSVGPPFLIESPGWFPVGGQLSQRAPTYPPPEITGLAFITPTDYAIFPHVPPWLMPLEVITKRFDYAATRTILERVQPVGTYVAPPAATAVCSLTLGDLKAKVYEQLDDDGTYYTGNEVRHALNVAQNTFALLTLCIERSVSFDLLASTCFHTISSQVSDFLVPLRVTCAGARVRPVTVHALDGLSSTWRSTSGTPTRYAIMGYDLLVVTPQPAEEFTSIVIRYAAMPAQMLLDTGNPEIPSEQQVHLVDYACWWLRLKEGGQELANASDWLKRFVEAARKYGDFVRRRSYGQKYDTVPFDLSSFDMGRLDIKLKR